MIDIKSMVVRRSRAGVAYCLEVPSFHAVRGQFVGLVGESGSGKSTMLDLLAMVLRPHSVEHFTVVDVEGRSVDVAELWRKSDERSLAGLRRSCFGYVLQAGGLMPFLTVYQNAWLAAETAGRSVDAAHIRSTAERLGIASQLEKKPASLSGGQRQRAAILAVAARRSPAVLADEPTGAIDQGRAVSIMADLSTLATAENAAVIVVSHDGDLLAKYASVTYRFSIVESSEDLTRAHCAMI